MSTSQSTGLSSYRLSPQQPNARLARSKGEERPSVLMLPCSKSRSQASKKQPVNGGKQTQRPEASLRLGNKESNQVGHLGGKSRDSKASLRDKTQALKPTMREKRILPDMESIEGLASLAGKGARGVANVFGPKWGLLQMVRVMKMVESITASNLVWLPKVREPAGLGLEEVSRNGRGGIAMLDRVWYPCLRHLSPPE